MDKTTKVQRTKSVVSCYKRLFTTEDGKRVLADLMKAHKVMSSTFSKDPYETALNEGERNVVLRILKHLHFDMEQFEQRIEQVSKNKDPFWDK